MFLKLSCVCVCRSMSTLHNIHTEFTCLTIQRSFLPPGWQTSSPCTENVFCVPDTWDELLVCALAMSEVGRQLHTAQSRLHVAKCSSLCLYLELRQNIETFIETRVLMGHTYQVCSDQDPWTRSRQSLLLFVVKSNLNEYV